MTTTKKTQLQIVREHLEKHGYITPLVAANYGVSRLAARIKDLKDEGEVIENEFRYDDNRKRYSYYTLAA